MILPITLYQKYFKYSDEEILEELKKKRNGQNYQPKNSNYQDMAEIIKDFGSLLDKDEDYKD